MKKVSIITPTYNREKCLQQIQHSVLSQDYPDLEWLVLDDSPTPSKVLGTLNTPNMYYKHITKRLSVGEKRNQLIDLARGSIIVHFDDDDFYSPNYISTVVAAIHEKKADLLNLRGWFLFDNRTQFFGYWNLEVKEGLHFECGHQGVSIRIFSKDNNTGLKHNHLGYGFGWAYQKKVWQSSKFSDKSWNEDGEFALKALENFKLDGIMDTQGICLHIFDASNTSKCFPQHQLPIFMLAKYFPLLNYG